MTIQFDLPQAVIDIIKTLKFNGHQAYIVGGSVRDFILKNKPRDYDICTSALPNEIMSYFNKTIPIGIKYGTVVVMIGGVKYEITTMRNDSNYKDNRRPDDVNFVSDIAEDLSKRDFTINAMAYDPIVKKLIDPFNGHYDLINGIIKAVGNPDDRFKEDVLRTMRAIRFVARYGFRIHEETLISIEKHSNALDKISAERIRDELMKILQSSHVDIGLLFMRHTGMFNKILPEIVDTYNCSQNKYHKFDVFGHLQHAVMHVPINRPLVRLAALLHDIGKPCVKALNKRGDYSFLKHEIYSARITDNFMKRMKFSNNERLHVVKLVKHHMDLLGEGFKDKTIRKFIYKIGKENIEDYICLRRADASAKSCVGMSKENLIQLNKLIVACNKQTNNMIHSPKDLALNGFEIMEIVDEKSGALIGMIIERMVRYVLSCPHHNTKEQLSKLAPGFLKDIKKLV